MKRKQSEGDALAQLQRVKTSYQSFIKLNYEHVAEDCGTCPTRGVCCTDAHFVNVHITRLEAIAIRETLARTPRLNEAGRRAVYKRAGVAVEQFNLSTAGDTFSQTFACPLFNASIGCLVHARAKPAPCIQHACYENWEDLPPASLQARTEHRIEQLNEQVYGAAWAWLPVPLWLSLVDPESSGAELERLLREWEARGGQRDSNSKHQARPRRASLPIVNQGTSRF